jgi:hypothetical protein
LSAAAFSPAFLGGIFVAAGDIEVEVFDALAITLLDDFFAYDPRFLGGVFVGGA